MGGSQAGAPADDDDVPWSRPPWRGHRDLASHGAGRPTRTGPDPGTGAGLGPDPARKANREGQGEAARGSGGAEEICQRAATVMMLRLIINDMSNQNKERISKVCGTA
jgi:hypothetical protein